nr:MAG TPA: hypothetical protein [Caudoviricetes sp.]
MFSPRRLMLLSSSGIARIAGEPMVSQIYPPSTLMVHPSLPMASMISNAFSVGNASDSVLYQMYTAKFTGKPSNQETANGYVMYGIFLSSGTAVSGYAGMPNPLKNWCNALSAVTRQLPPFCRYLAHIQGANIWGLLIVPIAGCPEDCSVRFTPENIVETQGCRFPCGHGVNAGHALFFCNTALHGGIHNDCRLKLCSCFPFCQPAASTVRCALFLHQNAGFGQKVIQQTHHSFLHALSRGANAALQVKASPLVAFAFDLVYEYPPKDSL